MNVHTIRCIKVEYCDVKIETNISKHITFVYQSTFLNKILRKHAKLLLETF